MGADPIYKLKIYPDQNAVVLHFNPGDKRPRNHCQICWQSRARGSGFDHFPCQSWMWEKAVDATGYILPLLHDITEEIDNWLATSDQRQELSYSENE